VALEDREERSNAAAEALEARLQPVMAVAAILVLPTLLIEVSVSSGPGALVAQIADWVIWLAFAGELAATTLVADDRRRWLARHPLEIALVILTPPFAPAMVQGLRAGRALRLLRLGGIIRLAVVARVMLRLLSPEGLAWGGVTTMLIVVGGGALFSQVERAQHLSAWDGAWWALMTVTTVGYGDVYPHTTTGRILAIAIVLSGIGFVALLTGAITASFTRQARSASHRFEQDMLSTLQSLVERLDRIEARMQAEQRSPAAEPAPALRPQG
jgi:voltage-gated potassium channel